MRYSPPSLAGPAAEVAGRVRTNSGATEGRSLNLFYRGRHQWLCAVARDRLLPGGALRVAVLIWEHLNAQKGYAWPSLPYIGENLGLHRSSVIRSIAALEERGWLSVERKAGRHRGNHYRISFGLIGGR